MPQNTKDKDKDSPVILGLRRSSRIGLQAGGIFQIPPPVPPTVAAVPLQSALEASRHILRSSHRSDVSPSPNHVILSPNSNASGKEQSPVLRTSKRVAYLTKKQSEAAAATAATAAAASSSAALESETINVLSSKKSPVSATRKQSPASKADSKRPQTEPRKVARPKAVSIRKPPPPPPPPPVPYYAEDKDYKLPPWRTEGLAPPPRGRNGPSPKSKMETFITVLSIVGRRGFGSNIVNCLFLNRQIYSFGTDYSHNGHSYLNSHRWVQEYDDKKTPIIQGYDDDEIRSLYDNPVKLKYLWRSMVNLKLGGFSETRLMRATEVNNIAEVKRLLALGANVHATDCQGETALMRACRLNRQRLTKLLAEKGSVNAENHDGWTALHFAASRNRGIICKTLVADWKANIEARDGSQRTPLHVAAWNGCVDSVTVLLDLGASMFAKSDGRGRTALAWALRYRRSPQAVTDGKARVANLLLSRGSDRYGSDVIHEQSEYHRYLRKEQEYKAALEAEPSDGESEAERTLVKG
jgi:hypothetical protein